LSKKISKRESALGELCAEVREELQEDADDVEHRALEHGDLELVLRIEAVVVAEILVVPQLGNRGASRALDPIFVDLGLSHLGLADELADGTLIRLRPAVADVVIALDGGLRIPGQAKGIDRGMPCPSCRCDWTVWIAELGVMVHRLLLFEVSVLIKVIPD